MRHPRLFFTTRGLMIAVAVVASLLGALRAWREMLLFLPALALASLPLVGSRVRLVRLPRQRAKWRYGYMAVMLAWVILGSGWLWARSVIRSFQQREGYIAIGGAARGAYYEFWGWTVPSSVTGICLVTYVSGLAILCLRRRRFVLLLALVGYALLLAYAWLAAFVPLAFEAFD
jgi:hypothetical protein